MDTSQFNLFLESPIAPWATLVCGYLLGSLPFAVWVGQLAGQDPRKKGSKNPGTSNVTRLTGWKWGILTLLLDLGKGMGATWLGLYWGTTWGASCAFASILGQDAECPTRWRKLLHMVLQTSYYSLVSKLEKRKI